jgi:hypothetical protein
VPGPGAYNEANLNDIKEHSPSAVFGHSSRERPLSSQKQTPGPGAYEKHDLIGNKGSLSKSMGLKPSVEILEKERLMTPGPGQYSPNANEVKRASPSYVIGTSHRHDFTHRKLS